MNAHPIVRLRKRLAARLRRTPLWVILTVFITIIMLCLAISLSHVLFSRSYEDAVSTHETVTKQMLELKLLNLENQLSDLAAFSIQPCYDTDFYRIIGSTQTLKDSDRSYLISTVNTYYYSRKDLLSYEIILFNHQISVGRDVGEERVSVKYADIDALSDAEDMKACLESGNNAAILPSEEDKSLFTFSHLILTFPDGPAALVRIKIDRSLIPLIESSEHGTGVIYRLFNAGGDLIYESDGGSEITQKDTAAGGGWLSVTSDPSASSLTLTQLTDRELIVGPLKKTQVLVFLQTVLLWFLFCLLAFFLIRRLTRPLSQIAARHKAVGRGDFARSDLSSSCLEITQLSDSLDDMTARIKSLLDSNYAMALNEKSAQLAALEAQINPHFLYNTLQAIGSEALVGEQTTVYDMLTRLARNLRYSIKESNLVPLKSELEYMNNYVALMKLRLEDNLNVKTDIRGDVSDIPIPKVSLQMIVENSIVHGMTGANASISVDICVSPAENDLVICVRDDGAGIDENTLRSLRADFKSQTLQDAGSGIGLANLYHRLMILYAGKADLSIDSRTGDDSYTVVTMRLKDVIRPGAQP